MLKTLCVVVLSLGLAACGGEASAGTDSAGGCGGCSSGDGTGSCGDMGEGMESCGGCSADLLGEPAPAATKKTEEGQ